MKKISYVRLGWQCLIVILMTLFTACRHDSEKHKVKVASKGLPYELLVVVDDDIWKSMAGDSLKVVLEGSVPGLPQNEPLFRLLRVSPDNYVRTYVTMRNILFVKTDPQTKVPRIGVAYDSEASPQICVSVEAGDKQALAEFVGRQKKRIADLFVDSELALETARLKKKYNKEVDQASRQIFGVSVHVPSELASLKKGDHFLWASTNRIDKDMNYVCYTMPMANEDEMWSDYWIEQRDSAMKRNIPGSKPDQWMTTTRIDRVPLVVFDTLTIAGRRVYEMRGLWEVRKGGIGGPFVSLAYPDPAAGRMVVTEGFVYSPRTNKRDLVRRMEAALRGVENVGGQNR